MCALFFNKVVVAIIQEGWIFCLAPPQGNTNLLNIHGIIPTSHLYQPQIISYIKDTY